MCLTTQVLRKQRVYFDDIHQEDWVMRYGEGGSKGAQPAYHKHKHRAKWLLQHQVAKRILCAQVFKF